jgi:glutamyl-tRNA synthetase
MVEADLERPLDADERSILETIAPLIQERTKLLPEAAEQVRFIYADVAYDDDSWEKVMTKDEVPSVLDEASRRLAGLDTWRTEEIETALRAMLADLDLGARKGLQPLRVAVSGSTVSPPLFESMEAMGRERTLDRLATAGARLGE